MLNVENSVDFISFTGIVPPDFRTQIGVGLQAKLGPSLVSVETSFRALGEKGAISEKVADIGRSRQEQTRSFLEGLTTADSVIVFQTLAIETGSAPKTNIEVSDTTRPVRSYGGEAKIQGKVAQVFAEAVRHELNTAVAAAMFVPKPKGEAATDEALTQYDTMKKSAESIRRVAEVFDEPGSIIEIQTRANGEAIAITVLYEETPLPIATDVFTPDVIQAA